MKHKSPSNTGNNTAKLLLTRVVLLLALLLLFSLLVRNGVYSEVTLIKDNSTENESVTLSSETEAEVEVLSDSSAVIAVGGDFMVHEAVSTGAYDSTTGSYDYAQFFTYAGTWLEDADLAIVNLETTLAGAVTGYPVFSAPDELATDLISLGIDLVSTANNHCADYGTSGILRTIEVLQSVGLDYIGTCASQEEYDENMGVVVEEVNGITIAFLDYTYGVNYASIGDSYLVSRYNLNTSDESEASAELDTDKIDAEMAYARSLGTDLIIVLIHWGSEYTTTESSYQKNIADYLIARGADAVLGGHSHVPQSMEYRTVTDLDGNEKTAFVCYSLGNLISNMSVANSYITAILNLEITRTDGVTTITGISYQPMYLLNPGNSGTSPLVLLDIPAALVDYEGAQTNPYMTETLYTTLQTSMDTLQSIFGEEWSISSEVLTYPSDSTSTSDESDLGDTSSDSISITRKTTE